MRTAYVASLLFASGCIGSISSTEPGDDTPPTDPAKDLVVGFSHTTPIGTGQLGRHAIYDGCTTEELCSTQEVHLIGATVDRTDVLSMTVMTGASKFDVTALAPGTAKLDVMAQNTGVAAMNSSMVEVMTPDTADFAPVAAWKMGYVPHTCPAPIGFQTSVVSTFGYQLKSAGITLLGSGFYPFTSAELTAVLPADLGADGGVVKYAAGANATASTITSALLPAEIPINIAETIDGVTLGDQFKVDQDTLVFADGTAGGQPICFDATLRTATSNTPTICTVSDPRPMDQQWKGAGPYQINWLGAGTCSITMQITGVGQPVTKEYQPL